MAGSSLYAANSFAILNYKYCHNDNVRDILPPTLKCHHDVFRGNVSIDVAP